MFKRILLASALTLAVNSASADWRSDALSDLRAANKKAIQNGEAPPFPPPQAAPLLQPPMTTKPNQTERNQQGYCMIAKADMYRVEKGLDDDVPLPARVIAKIVESCMK